VKGSETLILANRSVCDDFSTASVDTNRDQV